MHKITPQIVTKMNVPGVTDVEIEGSETKGACAVLEVTVNRIFVTIGDDEEEDLKYGVKEYL